MSDTPRTDAVLMPGVDDYSVIEFARTLERENATLQASAVDRMVTFLTALEQRFPPRPACKHVVYIENVATEKGRENLLRLQLIGTYPAVPMYFQPGDLEKDVDQLLAEVGDTVARAAALILQKSHPGAQA